MLGNIEEEKKDDVVVENRIWDSCCMRLDSRAVQFFAQFLVIIITISFCFYQLVKLDDCEAQQAYLSLLTLILGVILPQPKFHLRG